MSKFKETSIYIREYPSRCDLDSFLANTGVELHELIEQCTNDINLLEEECTIMELHLSQGSEDITGGVNSIYASENNSSDNARDECCDGIVVNLGVLLPVEYKQTLLQRRSDDLQQRGMQLNRTIEAAFEGIRMSIEEADAKTLEIRMDQKNFEREVIGSEMTGGMNLSIIKNVSAEKVLKFFEDRYKDKTEFCKKLEEKTKSLALQINKHSKHLEQREGQGESLHQIDFDQLTIENQQFLERIKAKNMELVFLKQSTMESVQTLNNHTEKLNRLSSDQAHLLKDINQRKTHLNNLIQDCQKANRESALAEQKNYTMRIQHEAVRVPKVEDYIQQRAELYELEKAVLNWKRKVEIASGQLNMTRSKINALQRSVHT